VNPQSEGSTRTEPASDSGFAHRFVETNGIRMHYVEAGSGPLVLMLHGFPESWYSWRHQLPALAAAGFHAVAPDLRGYGQTGQPSSLEAYDIFQLAGDVVGLVNALGGAPAVIVGHDWGSWVTSQTAVLRPDLFRAVALLSVPYMVRKAMNQSEWEQKTYPGKIFYQAMLRSPQAEQVFNADPRASLLRGLYSLSGGAGPDERWNPVTDPNAPPATAAPAPKMPSWLTQQDLDFLEGEFKRSGFTGGLNYYRNMDRNWALTPFLDGAKLRQPLLFITGDKDPVNGFVQEELEALATNAPNLKKTVMLPNVGHWTQQENPDEVTRLLVEFLGSL
jgi:pimeloyl-ACP methyl ester carboxylesterase